MEKLMALSELEKGSWAELREFRCSPELQRRLEDLGLIPGNRLRCLFRSPAGSPAAYEIQGAVIALRKRDANRILVEAAL